MQLNAHQNLLRAKSFFLLEELISNGVLLSCVFYMVEVCLLLLTPTALIIFHASLFSSSSKMAPINYPKQL